jgi:hypothetical protein
MRTSKPTFSSHHLHLHSLYDIETRFKVVSSDEPPNYTGRLRRGDTRDISSRLDWVGAALIARQLGQREVAHTSIRLGTQKGLRLATKTSSALIM